MERWIDTIIIFQHIYKLKFQQLHTWCRVQYFFNNVVFVDICDHFGYFRHHLRQLFFFKEEIRIYMATIIFSEGSTIMCDCLFLANYVDAIVSGIMLELNRNQWDPSNGEFSRHRMLVGLAHVPRCSNIIFHINIRIHLKYSSIDNILATNDYQ